MRYHVAIKTGIEKMRIQGVCLQNVTDYSPFGVQLDGRSFESDVYRYGFGRHENENEISGKGNNLVFNGFGFDTRLARRWCIDPLSNRFPTWSTYAFSFNNPILFTDKDGEIPIIVIDEQSKTILIYQPVFVVTKGSGSIPLENIHKLQEEFDQNIITSHLQAISNSTNEKYEISIQFHFFEGGTFEEAKQKNKEAVKMLGMPFYGTFSSFSNDEMFEEKYKDLGGEKDPQTIGGFTVNKTDVFMRGSQATIREKIHEGFHLLLADDDINAVGIMKYMDEYGKGPGVILENVQEVLNKAIIENPGGVIRFDKNGFITQGDLSEETFYIKDRNKVYNPGRGSGMGSMHLENLDNSKDN